MLNEHITQELANWSNLLYRYENVFIATFCKGVVNAVAHVSWNDERMYFVYVQDDGQHIADSVPISEWFAFKNCILKYV
jgi:hypothetical protein